MIKQVGWRCGSGDVVIEMKDEQEEEEEDGFLPSNISPKREI